ncbi:SdrD B-like domain-containing protein [Lentzea sp. NPDC051213]|uniref:SdrD B-like domain-containing protein n=1 Tax=Lentzea sp. NPDC051213 TaxID=3364126 RepID=UPI0037B37859
MPLSRKPRTIAVLSIAALLAVSGTAFAQDDPVSTSPVPTETSTPTPPTSEPAQPPREAQAPPPAKETSVSGVLYADKNRNGQQDPGEAIEGGKVTLIRDRDNQSQTHKATSAADGKFSFRDIQPGAYLPVYELADGWVVHHAEDPLLTVVVNQPVELAVRAERPYSEQLKAAASFDHSSYQFPGTATVTLTLTNVSDRELRGISADCDSVEVEHGLGRAQGWRVLTGDGVTLAPGEQRTFTIPEAVPPAGRKRGLVTLDCHFAPVVDLNTDGPAVHRTAAVNGVAGGYTVVIGEDRNADQRIDGDEAVRDTKIVLLNPKTGGQVAQGTSGADGKIQFSGLPVGDYRAVVVGPWAFADAGGSLVRITDGGDFGYRFLKRASPVKLRSTVKFDKERYESHETVRFDLTVTNDGGQVAERVRLLHSVYDMAVPDEQWGDFRWDGPGLQIPAGESRTFSVSGKIRDFSNGKLTLYGGIDFIGRTNADQSYYSGEVDVVETTGAVEGVVYADKNHNGQQDPGEAVAGAEVGFGGGAPYVHLAAVTDANGRFSFADVPSGDYSVHYSLAGGWLVHTAQDNETVRVEPGPVVQLTARAERPYSEMLKATVVLDKTEYVIGEEAKISIKLTNTSNQTLSGITAQCSESPYANQFGNYTHEGVSAGWGELLPPGKGVTVGPGETKTFVAAEEVPAGARLFHKVVVECDFAPNAARNTDGPRGYDWASVPGGSSVLKGRLAHDRNKNSVVDPGEAIAGTRIVLRTHRENGANVVEATSDADGNVRFESVPAGEFWAWVDGPWKFEGDDGGRVYLFAEGEQTTPFFVVPGERPSPDNSGGTESGGTGGALAKTGASVLGLGLVAALLVAFGIGARIAGRRKTA